MTTAELAIQEFVNQLSKKLTVRPIKKARMYKLCRTGQVDTGTTNEATNQPIAMFNPTAFFEGIETIYDIGEDDPRKANKIIENVVGFKTETKDGITRSIKRISAIEFNNGVFMVQPKDYNTLVFMERSSNNKNNPFRDTSKSPVWEAMEEEKSNELLLADEEMKSDSIYIAKNMGLQEARAYAQKLGMPGLERASATEIKLFLINKAKENPKDFIIESGDVKAMIKLHISDAKAFGIIVFNASKNVWEQVYPEPKFSGEKRIAPKKIVAVKAGEIPEDVLFDFFIQAGKQNPEYIEMTKALQNPEDYL
jgi:hypothetical protein